MVVLNKTELSCADTDINFAYGVAEWHSGMSQVKNG